MYDAEKIGLAVEKILAEYKKDQETGRKICARMNTSSDGNL